MRDGVMGMRSHVLAGLIVLAAATGSPASPSPSPSVLESPSPTPESTPMPESTPARVSTNLTAVVDPIAVRVKDGYQIRVGARNSGPRTITAPVAEIAVGLTIITPEMMRAGRSLGDCQVSYRFGPNPNFPPEPWGFNCQSSARTLRAGQTYWQSFVFPQIPTGYFVSVYGYVQDANDRDNRREVVVRLGKPSLPVTGVGTAGIAGAGFGMLIVGTMAIWFSRRRRKAAGSAG